jgi:hypothetical protein
MFFLKILNERDQSRRQPVVDQILDRFEGSIAAIDNEGEVPDIIYQGDVALAEKTSLQFILQEG